MNEQLGLRGIKNNQKSKQPTEQENIFASCTSENIQILFS